MLYLRRAANFRNIIKVAVRIGLFKIDRGRNLVVLHGDKRCGDTSRAACTLRMSNLGFER